MLLAAMTMLGAVAGFIEFVALRGRTPGIDSPRSVSSLERLEIGGVPQWILIRGHDRTRPLLLFLHGGPGMPAMFLAHAVQRDMERDFVVVHWDRRGAGKSFDAMSRSSTLSVSQTLEDTSELTRSLRARFDQERIILVGHSWGSYLGLLAIRRDPEYYSAFVGTGQLAGTRDDVQALRRQLVYEAAGRRGDSELQARAADVSRQITEDDLFRAGGELHGSRSFWPILKTGLAAPEYTLRDALHVKQGADLVGRAMRYDVLPRLLDGEVDGVDVPVFFFLGRHDVNAPSQLAAQYLERLHAPLKQLVWFEQSAHFPFFEEPDRFHRQLRRAAQTAADFWNRGSRREAIAPDAVASEQENAANVTPHGADRHDVGRP
jgi:pimeloyl-ACP methyl ester carboxylesterase